MRASLYWDDFERRIIETVEAIQAGNVPPVRRVAVFITDRCNFHCKYCNSYEGRNTLSESAFHSILEKYGETAIIHLTGGEPSLVPWLYPLIEANKSRYRFHLNTNAYVRPPFEAVRRLKVSLDHQDEKYWDHLVQHKGAFAVVVKNIKEAIPHTVTSITTVLTKESYQNAPTFAQFVREEFPGLYALFFSIYKGTNPKYLFTDSDAECFFNETLPRLQGELSEESLALLMETIDEKRRLTQGIRFPQNNGGAPCYLSMSERVISPTGVESMCSHLYRDGISHTTWEKNEKCVYGCNRRLVKFNDEVEKRIAYKWR